MYVIYNLTKFKKNPGSLVCINNNKNKSIKIQRKPAVQIIIDLLNQNRFFYII